MKGLNISMKRLIKNGTIVEADGSCQADLLIVQGKVTAIGPELEVAGDVEVIDASGCYVFPGGIDVHTHFDIDVGIARSCDDFFTGTRAAACGGTTTIVDHMGFGPKGCDLHHQLSVYHRAAEGKAVIDYSFHGVIQRIDEGILAEMASMVSEEGISSFKFYLTYGYKLGDADVLRALMRLREVGALSTVHPEVDAAIAVLRDQLVAAGQTAQAAESGAGGRAGHRRRAGADRGGVGGNIGKEMSITLPGPRFLVPSSPGGRVLPQSNAFPRG